jgi:hypothetical protein
MNEKLVLAALAVLNVLALYWVWLMMPEKFLLVLTGYLAILIFGVGLALAGSQEYEERRQEERCRLCVSSN